MSLCVEGRLVPTCGNGECDCAEIPSYYFDPLGDCPQDCGCEAGGCPLAALEDCPDDGTPCCAFDGDCDPAAPRRCVASAWQDAAECPE